MCRAILAETRFLVVFCVLLMLALFLAGCASQDPHSDLQADRVDVVTLPKFGLDPHWGGREIPPEIRAQRAQLIQQLAERGADPGDFALEVTQTGWEAMSKLDFSTAMRRFNQAWLVQPKTPFAVMGMAMVVFDRDGDVEGGLLLMQSLEQPLVAESSYWINRASMEKRSGMINEALEHFQTAMQLAPNNPVTIKGLVELYGSVSNFPAACALLTKARQHTIQIDQQLSHYIETNSSSSCVAL